MPPRNSKHLYSAKIFTAYDAIYIDTKVEMPVCISCALIHCHGYYEFNNTYVKKELRAAHRKSTVNISGSISSHLRNKNFGSTDELHQH